jgi:hypothetical protein
MIGVHVFKLLRTGTGPAYRTTASKQYLDCYKQFRATGLVQILEDKLTYQEGTIWFRSTLVPN